MGNMTGSKPGDYVTIDDIQLDDIVLIIKDNGMPSNNFVKLINDNKHYLVLLHNSHSYCTVCLYTVEFFPDNDNFYVFNMKKNKIKGYRFNNLYHGSDYINGQFYCQIESDNEYVYLTPFYFYKIGDGWSYIKEEVFESFCKEPGMNNLIKVEKRDFYKNAISLPYIDHALNYKIMGIENVLYNAIEFKYNKTNKEWIPVKKR